MAASLLGAGVLTNSETYLRADGSLAPVPMLDHDQTMVGPGERILQLSDGWIAVSAIGDASVAALCGALGAGSPDQLPSVASNRSTRDTLAALAALAAVGVPAAAVRQGQRGSFFDDPDHLAAGLVASYTHADWGRLEQPGAMWWFGDQEVTLHRAPPVLGEHIVDVLRGTGLAQTEIDELLAAGAAVQR